MAKLAIYDMDKTITRAPTWTRFLWHAAKARAPWRLAFFPAAGVAGLLYLLGVYDRGGLKQATQRLMLGPALTPEAMAGLADSFAEEVAATGVFEGARGRIAADRAQGYRLVLATASHRYYAERIAKRLGFDDVVATDARRDDHGRFLPVIEGDNCYGPVKLRMVESWMAREGLSRANAHVRAYSDHVSDAPLLEWADEAFAVNAHGPLERLARGRGWAELDWRG